MRVANRIQVALSGSVGAASGPSIIFSIYSSQRYSPLQPLRWSRALRRTPLGQAYRR